MKTVPVTTAPAAPTHALGAEHAYPHHPSTLHPAESGAADPDRPFEEGAFDTTDPELRHRLISAAAFELYAERGYADGHEMEDWLAAEAQIDHLLLNPQYAPGARTVDED